MRRVFDVGQCLLRRREVPTFVPQPPLFSSKTLRGRKVNEDKWVEPVCSLMSGGWCATASSVFSAPSRLDSSKSESCHLHTLGCAATIKCSEERN